MKTRIVKKLNANDFAKHLGETPHTSNLHPEELDLIIAYRVMNKIGKNALIKVAMDFAMTPTMRNKCIKGI